MNDTTLREHQHRMALADSKLCEEADGIEDAYHFFFQCTKYSDSRDYLPCVASWLDHPPIEV